VDIIRPVNHGRARARCAEVRFEGQSIAARTSLEYDDAFAHRETTAHVLFGYGSPPARKLAYNVLGGISYVRAMDSRAAPIWSSRSAAASRS